MLRMTFPTLRLFPLISTLLLMLSSLYDFSFRFCSVYILARRNSDFPSIRRNVPVMMMFSPFMWRGRRVMRPVMRRLSESVHRGRVMRSVMRRLPESVRRRRMMRAMMRRFSPFTRGRHMPVMPRCFYLFCSCCIPCEQYASCCYYHQRCCNFRFHFLLPPCFNADRIIPDCERGMKSIYIFCERRIFYREDSYR